MHLTLKETKDEVYASQRVSKHVSPHLHNADRKSTRLNSSH